MLLTHSEMHLELHDCLFTVFICLLLLSKKSFYFTVNGSCAKHSTVESYTVVMLPTVILISILSPPHSFISGLKPSFSANPSHCSLPFLLLQD